MRPAGFNWGIVFIAIGASFWGLDQLVRQPLVSLKLPSSSIVLGEHLVLLLYAIPAVMLGWPIVKRLRGPQWAAVIAIGWGASAIATVLFTEGFRLGDPLAVLLLQKTQPLFAVVLARIALGERLTPIYWPLLGLAMVGAYLIAFPGLEPLQHLPTANLAAAGFGMGAALLWGGGTVLGRLALANVPFHTLTGLRFLVATPLLLLLAIPGNGLGETGRAFTADPVNLALLALIPGLAGMIIYYFGLTRTPASIATIGELAFPFTAAMISWAVFGKAPQANQVIGFVLVWAAVVVLGRLDAARTATAVARPATSTAG